MQSLGLVSILFLAASIICMFIIWPGDVSKTLSQNAARTKASSIYYFVIFAFFLVLFSIFMFKWLIPNLHMGAAFKITFIVGSISQLVAVCIPETKGLQRKVHIVAAGAMSLMTLLITALLAYDSSLGLATRVASGAAVLIMLICWYFTISYRGMLKHALFVQLSYFLSFLTVIMVASYLN